MILKYSTRKSLFFSFSVEVGFVHHKVTLWFHSVNILLKIVAIRSALKNDSDGPIIGY